jgi:hypothetical protein
LWCDDKLHTVGSYQIVSSYAQTFGELLIESDPNSNVLLEYTNKNDIVPSKEYKKYKIAFKNEVNMSNSERFKSINEE